MHVQLQCMPVQKQLLAAATQLASCTTHTCVHPLRLQLACNCTHY
jgi:hypothetical protein